MVSVCLPLMLPCNTYHLTWVSLNLDVAYIFMAAPAKCSHCSLPWTRGYLLTATPPDLECGVAPLGPPVPTQPLLLGRKVMTNLDSISKSRDITLPTKVCLVKAMVYSSGHIWMLELDCEEG